MRKNETDEKRVLVDVDHRKNDQNEHVNVSRRQTIRLFRHQPC